MPDIVDCQEPPRHHRRLFFLVLAILAIVIFSSRTAVPTEIPFSGFHRCNIVTLRSKLATISIRQDMLRRGFSKINFGLDRP
jgi:hypothetical protein